MPSSKRLPNHNLLRSALLLLLLAIGGRTNTLFAAPPAPPGPDATGAQPITQSIALTAGWNTISLHVTPLDPSTTAVFGDLDPDLVLAKNGAGETYWPEFGIDQIGAVVYSDGYQVYMSAPRTLNVVGLAIDPTLTPISLKAGWNLTAYLVAGPLPIADALASLGANLVVAKDNAGRIYWPSEGIDTIRQMEPGQGYMLYMNSDDALVYPPALPLQHGAGAFAPGDESPFANCAAGTGQNASLLMPVAALNAHAVGPMTPAPGDELAVVRPATQSCAGTAVWTGDDMVITVWGDDSQTTAVDGLVAGETMILHIWDASAGQTYAVDMSFVAGAATHPDGEYAVNRLYKLSAASPTAVQLAAAAAKRPATPPWPIAAFVSLALLSLASLARPRPAPVHSRY